MRSIPPKAAAWLVVLAAQSAQGQVFVGAQYEAGIAVRSMALADFDADGFIDIVSAGHGFSSGMTLARNNGHGGFYAPQFPFPGLIVTNVATGDLDSNGTADVVAMLSSKANVYVMLGDGNGQFTLAKEFVSTPAIMDIALADVDADGALDIVEAMSSGVSGAIRVWRGDGNGGFVEGSVQSAIGSKIDELSVSDVTGDGKLDAVTTAQQGLVLLFAGDGHGGFAAPVPITLFGNIASTTPGDLNNDGIGDIIAADRSAGAVKVRLAKPTGGFGFEITTLTGPWPSELAVADFDGDGKQDVAITNETGTYVANVLLGDGTGHFKSNVIYASGASPHAIAASDLDADGDVDLVIGNWAHALLTPLYGDGKGVFTTTTRFPAAASPWAIDLGDLDGDGSLDAVTPDAVADRFAVNRGDGKGGLLTPATFLCGHQPMGVTVADIDGDQRLDVITSNADNAAITGTVTVRINDGLGGFGPGTVASTGSGPRATGVADLNGDGRMDLISANFNGSSASVLIQQSNGSFASQDVAVGFSPRALAIGDVNGDGRIDFTVPHNGPTAAAMLLGNGDGTFQPKLDLPVPKYPVDVALVDLDGDGDLDLLVASDDTATLTLMRGDGAGGFGASEPHPIGFTSVQAFDLADVDGDGWLDVASISMAEISILLGDGKGGLSKPLHFATHSGSAALAFGDLDQDGRQDLAIPLLDTGSVTVLRNQSILGTGCKGSGGFVPTLTADGYVAAGDKTKLVIGSALGGTIALLVFGLGQNALPPTKGCTLLVPPPLAVTVLLAVGGNGPGNGSAMIEAEVREAVPEPIAVLAQAFVLDPAAAGGYASTNVVKVTTN